MGRKSGQVKTALEDFKDQKNPKEEFVMNGIDGEEDAHERSINEMIRYIVSQVPNPVDVYGKLYKISPLPEEFEKQGMIYLAPIKNIAEIDDIEIAVSNMVQKEGWGSGIYQIRIYRTDKKINTPVKINLAIHSPQQETPDFENISSDFMRAPSHEKDSFEEIEKVASLAGKLKELAGGNGHKNNEAGLSPDAMLRAISESLNTGITLAKGNAPAAPDMATMMMTMVKMMSEMGVFQQKKQEDPLDMLVKLKEAGLIKTPGDAADELTGIEKLLATVAALKPLMGETSGEPATASMRLVELVAPKIPDIIGNVTGTLNNFLEVSKMKMGHKLNTVNQLPNSPRITPETLIQKQEENPPQQEPEMHPQIKKIYDAVKSNDISFYPELENMINIFVGTHIIPALVSGEIPVPAFLTQLKSMVPALDIPETELYLNNFIESKRKDIIIGVCSVCKTEYDYPTKDDFESDNMCDCGGTIELPVNSELVGNA